MGALKAIKPEVIESGHAKMLLSGKSGVGKTMFALDWPKPYFIDTEGGAVRPEYKKKLVEIGAGYLGKEQGSQDFKTIIEELTTLATTKHDYKTLIIDSFSALYNRAASIAEEKLGSDFGKDKKEANRPTRQLMRWIEAIDMNVLLVCHSKDKWERKRGQDLSYGGTTFDGYDKLEYILDLWIEIEKTGPNRTIIIKKSRIASLPQDAVFPLNFKKFSEIYGENEIDKAPVSVVMAGSDQVQKVKDLLEVVKVDQADIDKWMTKADVDTFDEMTEETITKIIVFLENKLKALQPKAKLEAVK